MYAALLMALSVTQQPVPPQDMLAERVSALEQRVAAVESRLAAYQPPRSPAAPSPAPNWPYPPVDVPPVQNMPLFYSGGAPAYYGAAGACAGGSCGPAGVFGFGQPVRGFFRQGGVFRR